MEPGTSRYDRLGMLLQTLSELDAAEERRAFLNEVCADEPALANQLLETATLRTQPSTPDQPDNASELVAGQLVAGRFEVVRKLGEGGMAVVYEAIDRKLSERRALKFPKAGHSATIPPEARSALRITHSNICRIHEIHTTPTGTGSADFISMEFVEGETLLSRWRREAIPAKEVIDIACQLCRGLTAAHDADILHRDLKSNNVMLTRHTDGTLRVVIMDFGLAQPVGTSGRPSSSFVSGTPSYIAPERWKGSPATPATDVYALGVMLHEMLTGQHPFPAGTHWRQRLSEVPDVPSHSERAPDARWDPIVTRCLSPDPAQRFGSAREVLESIERAFLISHRRKWLAGAAIAAITLAPVVLLRDQIWPPPLARLAVLPFTGSAGDQGVDEAVRGGLYDLTTRLGSLGASSRRLVVIPLEDSLRYNVGSTSAAATRLGATHALAGTIEAHGRTISVRAKVTDLRNGEVVRDFTGTFQAADLAAFSTSLAGVVTSAFRLDKAPPASILPAAYADYAAGLAKHRSRGLFSEEALASFQRAAALDSSSPLVLSGLAEAFYRKFSATRDPRWLREASGYAHRAESLHPDSPPVLVVLGSIEQAEGRPERAIENYRRAAELEPNNSEAWRRTGIALQSIGRDTEAVEALRKSVQLAPGYYAPHVTLGFVHFRAGRYSAALDEYRTVTRLAPEMAEGYSSLGGVLLATGREPEAEQAFRQSLKLQETRGALNNLGVLLRYQHRDREAVEFLERALIVGADDIGLRLNLGNALRKIGRAGEARKNFQRASELARASLLRDPRDSAARARLAFSMVHLGSPGLAADEALQAARLGISDYSVLFWSVMTLEALRRRDDAFPLLAGASYERLRDLARQPDLAEFCRDPRFLELMHQAQASKTTQERKTDAPTQ